MPPMQQHSRTRTLSNNSSDHSLSEKPIPENIHFINNNVTSSQSYTVMKNGNTFDPPKTPVSSNSAPVLFNSYQNGSKIVKPILENPVENSKTSPNGVKQTDSQTKHSGSQNGINDTGYSPGLETESQIHISKSQSLSSDSGHSLSKANGGSAISQDYVTAESDLTESSEDVFLDPVEVRIPTFFSVMNPR